MFAHAYEIASKFTIPIIVSLRFFDGTTDCLLGAGIRVNSDGWLLSAAHLLDPIFVFQQHQEEMREYQKQSLLAEGGEFFQKATPNNKWITHYAYWWGEDGAVNEDLRIFPEADLALVRLKNIRTMADDCYPRFKAPAILKNGTSLCKLGFPFHQPAVSFDEHSSVFTLSEGTLPVPFFPLEGIYTRWISQGGDGKYAIKYIETSSTGLRGQSGGPIFDVGARVWGMQVKTVSVPLGYSPTIVRDGREIVENQFINLGWGIHPEVMVAFMRDNGVLFTLALE